MTLPASPPPVSVPHPPHPGTTLQAAIALGVAIFCIAAASILIIYAQTDLGANAITFNRLGLAAIACVLYGGSQGFREDTSEIWPLPSLGWGEMGLLGLAGITFAGSLSVWNWSMTQTSVANATLLENCLPIFTTLGGWLFLRQRFSRLFLAGMGLAILGVIAIGLGDLQLVGDQQWGDGAAMLSALLAAISLLSVEQLRHKLSTLWIMLGTSLVGTLFAFGVMCLTESQWFPQHPPAILAVISLSLISHCLGQGLLTFSLSHFTSAFVSVILLIVPAIAAILAWMLFGEALSIPNLLAFTVVLVGIYGAIQAPSVSSNPPNSMIKKEIS